MATPAAVSSGDMRSTDGWGCGGGVGVEDTSTALKGFVQPFKVQDHVTV